MLLRRRINGEDLGLAVSSTDAMGEACKRCHMDDLAAAAGTGQADRWEYVHHGVTGAPYIKATCINCHGSETGGTPIACGNCHGHGKIDSWAGANQTGRKTF
jgi:DnaJ-class molecular chaperone